MSHSTTIELGPNDQETIEYPVDDDTDCVLVTPKSTPHNDVTTIPTWEIDGEEFPEGEEGIEEYPGRLEPLGDMLLLKIRNEVDQAVEVTVGLREKKLASA